MNGEQRLEGAPVPGTRSLLRALILPPALLAAAFANTAPEPGDPHLRQCGPNAREGG